MINWNAQLDTSRTIRGYDARSFFSFLDISHKIFLMITTGLATCYLLISKIYTVYLRVHTHQRILQWDTQFL
jgi:hypothetical protein